MNELLLWLGVLLLLMALMSIGAMWIGRLQERLRRIEQIVYYIDYEEEDDGH